MTKYKFNGDKYVTSGIDSRMPKELQLFLFRKIEGLLYDGIELDYLQVFRLKRCGNTLHITHEQEIVDPFCMSYILELSDESIDIPDEKVFIIDDISHVTMLFAYEY